MNNTHQTISTSPTTKMAIYEFDMDVNDDDILKIAAFNTYLELSKSGESLINMSLVKNARIQVTVKIEIANPVREANQKI
jgi:hypothetical protein